MLKISIPANVINAFVNSANKANDLADTGHVLGNWREISFAHKVVQVYVQVDDLVIDVNPAFIIDFIESVDVLMPSMMALVNNVKAYKKLNDRIAEKLMKKYFNS